MSGETFPSDWRDEPCFVVAIPKPLVPYVGGLLKILENRGFWDAASFEDAYSATIALEGCLMATCLSDLIESQDRLYRLVNTSVFGQLYDVTIGPPLVVTPDIAPAVDLTVFDQDSIMGRLDRLTQLTDNSLNGTETPLYNYIPDIKTLLANIKSAIEANSSDSEDLLAQLEQIVILLG